MLVVLSPTRHRKTDPAFLPPCLVSMECSFCTRMLYPDLTRTLKATTCIFKFRVFATASFRNHALHSSNLDRRLQTCRHWRSDGTTSSRTDSEQTKSTWIHERDSYSRVFLRSGGAHSRRIFTAGVAIAECQPTCGSLLSHIARQRTKVLPGCRHQLLHERAAKAARRPSRIRTASCFTKTQSATPSTHAVQPHPSRASSDTDISGTLQPRGRAGYHVAGSRTSDKRCASRPRGRS